jgi:Mrp family chromosome partitioning ATPase
LDVVDVVVTKGVGIISVLEDRDLSKEFQFLKRALLAKIFGSGKTDTDTDAGRVIMVTSGVAGAGKSFTAFNLAVSIARERLLNVVLVDADSVRRNLTISLGSQDREGLLEDLSDGGLKASTLQTDIPSLKFLPTGQSVHDATELLASPSMSNLLAQFDDPDTVVVVDATPLLISTEASAICRHADQVLIIVEAGVTSVDELEAMLKLFVKSDSNISFVMNKLTTSNHSGADHYYYANY